ncbi:MAG: hypothetical protein NXI31_06725 [bacterium]|nr:hypothetical protein [bacterium]
MKPPNRCSNAATKAATTAATPATPQENDGIDTLTPGDRQAVCAFCEHYLPIVKRHLRALWRDSTMDANVDDATQDVFVECLRSNGALSRLDVGRGHGLAAYVRGITRNIAARLGRRRARECRRCYLSNDLVSHTPDRTPDGLELLDRTCSATAVREAVARLDREPAVPGHSLGELVRLHFGGNQPVREIAKGWEVRPARVHEARRRACQHLRKLLLRV